jgi:hypothetical protein
LIYTGNSELDGFEQRHAVFGSYRVTPLTTLSADASFSHETRPDRYVETTGIVVRQESDQQQYSAGAAVALSERLTGDVSYAYHKTDYNSLDSSDVEAHGVKGSLEYATEEYLPLLKLKTGASFNNYRYDAVTVRSYGATVGASCRILETWSAKGDVGGRFTHSRFTDAPLSPPNAAGQRDEVGWVASLLAVYRGEDDDDRVSFVLRRDLQSTTGRPGAVEETSATVIFARRISADLAGSIGGGWYRNRSTSASSGFDPVDQTSLQIHPSVVYKMSRNFTLEIDYEFATVHDHYENSDVSRNKVFVTLTGQMFIPR